MRGAKNRSFKGKSPTFFFKHKAPQKNFFFLKSFFHSAGSAAPRYRELKQRRRQRQRKRQLKKQLRVTSTTSRIVQFVQLVQCRRSIQELDC